jgi:hypothetical protein
MCNFPPTERGNGGVTLWTRSDPERHRHVLRFCPLELLTISRFLETVIWIVMGSVYVYRVTEFLQSESSINHKTLGTT